MRTVSNETYKFLVCLETLSKVYELTSSALSASWGENQAEDMIADEFSDKFDELESVIEKFMAGSIRNKLGIVNSNEF